MSPGRDDPLVQKEKHLLNVSPEGATLNNILDVYKILACLICTQEKTIAAYESMRFNLFVFYFYTSEFSYHKGGPFGTANGLLPFCSDPLIQISRLPVLSCMTLPHERNRFISSEKLNFF